MIWNIQQHGVPGTDHSARVDVRDQDLAGLRSAHLLHTHSLIVRPIPENGRVAYTAAQNLLDHLPLSRSPACDERLCACSLGRIVPMGATSRIPTTRNSQQLGTRPQERLLVQPAHADREFLARLTRTNQTTPHVPSPLLNRECSLAGQKQILAGCPLRLGASNSSWRVPLTTL